MFLGEGVLELGVGVGGDIGRQLQRLLHHVVGLGRAEVDDFALVGAVRDGRGLFGLGVVLGAEREVARQAQAVLQHRDIERGGVLERLGRAVEPVVARHQTADGVGARLGERTVGIEDRRRRVPLVVERTPQHAAALLRITHRLTVVVVRIVEVIADLQPFEHLRGDLRTEVHRAVGVGREVEQAVVVVQTPRKVVADLAVRTADRDVVRLGDHRILVKCVVVVRIAVVDILAVGFDRRFELVAREFALAEGVEPRTRKVLRVVEARRLVEAVVVPCVVEEARIDVTVVHDVGNGRGLLDGDVARVVDRELVGEFARVLGGDEHHAVGCARTVDGGRSCVLEHRDRLDVVGVEHRGVALDAVDQHQSRSARADRRLAADVVRRRAVGLAVGQRNIEVGHGALQHLRDVGHGTVLQKFRGDLVDGARQVGLLLRAVAHDHHLVDERGVLLQLHGDERTVADRDFGSGVAQRRDLQHGAVSQTLERERAVGPGTHAAGGSLDDHRGPDNGLARGIPDDALNGLRHSGTLPGGGKVNLAVADLDFDLVVRQQLFQRRTHVDIRDGDADDLVGIDRRTRVVERVARLLGNPPEHLFELGIPEIQRHFLRPGRQGRPGYTKQHQKE